MVFFGIAVLALVVYLVMLMWNWLVPELFSGPVINYWQSAGILILSKILFSGFSHRKKEYHGPSSYWRKRWESKMKGMTDEEKAAFRERFHKRFRHGEGPGEASGPEKDGID